ncbi:MAG: ArnT family glycosyltransferase [Armatimonadota bacterium]
MKVLVIIVILAAAIALRLCGLDWGLPSHDHFYSYHPDENIVLGAALNIDLFSGKLDPGFYNYGTLYIYAVNAAIFLAAGFGLINPGAADMSTNIGEFSNMYLAGRIVALLFALATVYAVYALARRAYGSRAGILAALFFALLPLHVMHSTFLAVDVPATFFAVVALIFAVRIPQEGYRARDYILAGLFAGLAAATKYNLGLVVLAPIAAHLAARKSRSALKLPLTPTLAVIGFLAGTPGVILNTPKFLADFTYELHHASTGHGLVFVGTGLGWVYHIAHSLAPGMGVPMLLLAAVGVLHALRKRTPADVALLAFLLVYFLVIGAAQVRFARYVIPILPVLSIFAARLVAEMLKMKRPVAGYAVCVGVALYTAACSVALCGMFARPDTRDLAVRWVRETVPPGITIGLPTIPWFYTPPLDPVIGMAASADERYALAQEADEYALLVSEDEWDAGYLRRSAPEYVILSEFEYTDRMRLHDRAAREYLRALDNYTLARRFADAPTIFGRKIPLYHDLPHDMSYVSPTILIYHRGAD